MKYFKYAFMMILIIFSTLVFSKDSLIGCLDIDLKENSSMSFWVNRCGVKISVKWFDQGVCETGCADEIKPYGKSTMTTPTGNYTFAVCEYPKFVSSSWRGGRGVPYDCK